MIRHSRASGNPEVVRNRPSFSAIGCPDAPCMHRNSIQTCTDCALRAPHGDRRDHQPAIELHHSRACGNPKVVRNRSSFSVIGCPDAPYVHWKCIQICTDCALRAPHGRPARPPTSDRNASFPRMRDPKGCRKPVLIQRHRLPRRPVYAPELHSKMH